MPGFAGKDIEYTIDVPGKREAGVVKPGKEMTVEEWKDFVENLDGAIEDPTFVRPLQEMLLSL